VLSYWPVTLLLFFARYYLLEDTLIRPQRGGRQPQQAKGPQVLTDHTPVSEVRLVDEDGNRVMTKEAALQLADDTGLDCILVSPDSDPPVVRLMDYGKFKFEAEKKAREAKKKQHTVNIKEIKFGIRIDDHDYGVKLNRARKFLDAGDKVKTTIRLRGREIQHVDLAFQLAQRFVDDLEDIAQLEGQIRRDSARQITLNFQPNKK
jgi:translation initiation factor IF-3